MRRLLVFVGAFAFAAGLAAPAFAQSAATGQTLDDCKLIPDDAARLACFDRVMKAGRGDVAGTGANVSPVAIPQPSAPSVGAAAPSTSNPAASVATGRTVSPPMTAEQRLDAQKRAFGLPAYAQSDVKQAKKQKLHKLATRVASVDITGPNRLRVTTVDGQVWDQTDGTAPRARVGDAFVIKAGIMGSKLCKVGSAETYRCVRVDRVADEEDEGTVAAGETTDEASRAPVSGGVSLAPATSGANGGVPPASPPAPLPIRQTASAGGPGSGGAGAGGPGTLGNRGNVSPPPMTAEQRREAATQSFGLPEADQPGAREKKQDEVTKLTTRVASVGVTGPNRLRITTTDGQVWDQTEGSPPHASVGDTFIIKSGFLGSKLCQVGAAQGYRCVRADRPQQS